MRALCRHVVVLLLVLASSAAGRLVPNSASTFPHVISAIGKKHHKKHKKHAFTSPVGLFIQERASKQLPGPGQHFQFGALVSWDAVLQTVAENPDAKLLLLIRHGQALSNWLEDVLGPDIWFQVESKCSYDDKNGTIYNVFDAELTDLGREQGRYLNSILDGGGWFARMVGNNSVRAVVSPLSRCLQTAQLVSQNLPIEQFNVEERVRETLGEDTCDARRSASDPDSTHPFSGGPCAFEEGLRTKYPMFEFPIVGQGRGLGLESDLDTLWTKNRETQKEQVARATDFLLDLWNFAPEKVVVVYTHSGFTRSILLAMGREPYRPQNTELVPAVVIKKQRAGDGNDDHDGDDHHDDDHDDHDHDDHDHDDHDDGHDDDHDDDHNDRDHDDDDHDVDHHHDNKHISGEHNADGDEEGEDNDEEQVSVA